MLSLNFRMSLIYRSSNLALTGKGNIGAAAIICDIFGTARMFAVVRLDIGLSLMCSAKIKRIASEIASLTLLETVDLTAVLKDTLKMTDRCDRSCNPSL